MKKKKKKRKKSMQLNQVSDLIEKKIIEILEIKQKKKIMFLFLYARFGFDDVIINERRSEMIDLKS
jgi:hypothetical protein